MSKLTDAEIYAALQVAIGNKSRPLVGAGTYLLTFNELKKYTEAIKRAAYAAGQRDEREKTYPQLVGAVHALAAASERDKSFSPDYKKLSDFMESIRARSNDNG